MRIIKINAVWCPGCLIMKKVWKQVVEQYPNLEITEYDYDFDEEQVQPWSVGQVLPVAIFLDDKNHEFGRLIGEKTVNQIIDMIESRGSCEKSM